jgi:glycosyltransferase involved in cell wall biosynthesis
VNRDSVVYVVPDKMGGMLNIVASLLANRAPDGMTCHAVLTRNRLDTDTPFGGRLAADTQTTVDFALPVENIYAVLKRLHDAIPGGGGVLVSNDLLELAMLHVYDTPRMVVQLLHGDHAYYYDLATRHQDVIDVFAAYSRAMYDELRRRLPHRAEDVLYMPYGIAPAERVRDPRASGPVRLLFAGRLEHGQKGVLELPMIDRLLADRKVPVTWSIIGAGPDESKLRAEWQAPHVTWHGALPHAEVLRVLADYDVFVLPTRTEGFPVALVEAMASGLVPVVSDIQSGVPEVVEDRVSGFRPAVGDVPGFAAAIQTLADDRDMLNAMSRAACARISADFNAERRTREYQQLFAGWRERRRPRAARPPLPYGSRLDRPWVPNAVVRAVRSGMRALAGKSW